MKKFIKYVVFPSLAVFLILLATDTLDIAPQEEKIETESLQYSEIITSIMENEISEMTLDTKTGKLKYKFRNSEKTEVSYLANPEFFHSDISDFINENNLKNAGDESKIIKINYKSGMSVTSVVSIATSLLTIGFMYIIMKRMLGTLNSNKTAPGMKQDSGFGLKSRAKSSKDKIKFDDVAGAEEEKEELSEIVDFLKHPDKFNDAGARVPKGILLVGPPGTGKTLLARAVAGETDVPFFSVSGSEFVEMFVGVGASRIRTLFEQAKKVSPSIIFIDEIDAVGGKREGSRRNGSNEEKEQTLNQLLVEMDGFSKSQNVIVIAATNRPDVLDEALLRPGRFDRQVTVNLPDVKGREQILKIHGKNKSFDDTVDFKKTASDIVGFSGADIENLLNESALRAVKNNRKQISQEDIDESMIKVMMGAEKKSLVISYEDKRLTAFHEAGHAITSYFLKTQDTVEQISIIPRGLSAGHTMFRPKNDNSHISKQYLKEQLCVMLGGRAGEEVSNSNICSGASNDIKRATELARKMVAEWGMDNECNMSFKDVGLCSEFTKKSTDAKVNNLLYRAYNQSKDILAANISKLHQIADVLCEQEKMTGEEFRNIMAQ